MDHRSFQKEKRIGGKKRDRAGRSVSHGFLSSAMKFVKRILAVVALVVLAFLIGYLLYTGGRFSALSKAAGLQKGDGDKAVLFIGGQDGPAPADNAAIAAGKGVLV